MIFCLEMLHQIISLAVLSSANCIPVKEKSNNQDTIDNIINVDEKPVKEVEIDSIDSTVPLGSQFAVEFLIPERKKLETGHRIPLHLFPIETQNRILEVETTTEVVSETEKYVDASSFRQIPSTFRHSPAELSIRNLFGQEREGDKTYHDTLNVFAPPSFFS